MMLLFVTSPLKLLSEVRLGSDRMTCFQVFIFLFSIGALLSDDNYTYEDKYEDNYEDNYENKYDYNYTDFYENKYDYNYTDFYEEEKKYKCITEEYEKCDDILLEVKFPETADELLDFCKANAADCSCRIQAEEEVCGIVLMADWEREKLNFIETACDKDNPIFKVISENLQCIKEYNKYDDLCHALHRNTGKFSSISEFQDRLWEEDIEAAICLLIHNWKNCEPIIIGYTCNNQEVKEAAKKVVHFGRNITFCTPENMEKVNPILEKYEAIMLEELRSYE